MKREFYNAANKYAKHGWSIIPIGRDKKPALRTWKGFQSKRPTDKQLRQWFLDGQGVRGQVTGLAAVCGDVSGDLVVRDFDSMEAYQAWAKAYPKLAAKLPTVQTARGRHVYFRNGHSRIEVMNDGELRGKGYVLLPPSIHPTGVLYDWIVPLSNGPLPEVPDPAVAGLIAPKKSPSSRETQKTQKTQENTENSSGKEKRVTVKSPAPPGARDSGESLDSIIDRTIPRSKGCRHRAVFRFCRAIKAMPEYADESATELRPVIQRWHEAALPFISTKPFEETLMDFYDAWKGVKYAEGESPMDMIAERAKHAPDPAEAMQFEQPELRFLIRLCQELQRVNGDKPFPLDGRVAAQKIRVPHPTAARWLRLLRFEKLLALIKKGIRHKASEYRYLGAL